MIPNVFDCKWHDQIDGAEFQYIDCELAVDIGPYKAGSEVAIININYEDGVISIFETEEATEPSWSGRIEYTFVEIEE